MLYKSPKWNKWMFIPGVSQQCKQISLNWQRLHIWTHSSRSPVTSRSIDLVWVYTSCNAWMEKGNIKVSSLLLMANTLAYIISTKKMCLMIPRHVWPLVSKVFAQEQTIKLLNFSQRDQLASISINHTVKLWLCANVDVFSQGWQSDIYEQTKDWIS